MNGRRDCSVQILGQLRWSVVSRLGFSKYGGTETLHPAPPTTLYCVFLMACQKTAFDWAIFRLDDFSIGRFFDCTIVRLYDCTIVRLYDWGAGVSGNERGGRDAEGRSVIRHSNSTWIGQIGEMDSIPCVHVPLLLWGTNFPLFPSVAKCSVQVVS